MWNSFVNRGVKTLDNFQSMVEKDQPTKGSFDEDYKSICTTYQLQACPHITQSESGIRVSGLTLDLPTWRSILLASIATGSKVNELCFHNCRITPQHILDISAVGIKSNTIRIVKLQYMDLQISEDNESQYASALASLASDTTGIQLLSLQSNQLSDKVIKPFITNLASNFLLAGLNLSNNNFTDEIFAETLNAIKYTTNVKMLSFAQNSIHGVTTLSSLLTTAVGYQSTSTEDTAVKGNTKVLGDKNKAIKEVNKKRKKAGQAELNELPPLAELMKKVAKQEFFSNRSLEVLDVSGIDFSLDCINEILTLCETTESSKLDEVKIKVYVSPSTQNNQLSRLSNVFTFV